MVLKLILDRWDTIVICDISHLIREKAFRVYIYINFFNFVDVFYNYESLLGLELKIST